MQRPIRFCISYLLGIGAFLVCSFGIAANDPRLVWHTIETSHFRINYYSGEAEIAERMADLAEAIYGRLTPVLGWAPTERTEIAITDQTDSANGSATALPFNTIRLFATAPDDLSPLGDVDDWYQELLSHEFTHIVHTDHIRGIPALINALIGKTIAPNQVQPRWLLEGLAVFEESSKTSGGRLRSSQWNMYMRADILEDNVATLDQFSNTPRRWPQGNIWYLYGSFFIKWIADTYGEQAIRRMVDDYGSEIIPYGINRSIRRATGRTFEELYGEWVQSLRAAFADQASAVRGRGIRQGIRITQGGQVAENPRFIPTGSWNDHAGEVVYFRDDGHRTAGLYAAAVPRGKDGALPTAPTREKIEPLVRTAGVSAATFDPDGNVIFDSVAVTNNLFRFNDLFRMPHGDKELRGLEGRRERLTDGFRATFPDVSSDGRHIVFTTNHRGTSYLQIADLVDGHVVHVRALVPSAHYDQAYAPRFSPNGSQVAYSVWTHGGYRDIRLVNVRDGSFQNVTHDRAIDGGPAFSPDGNWLFFHSDRTGIMNVYAYDVRSGALRQVTNVINGAYQPAISPDGKTLVYVGYTSRGFDLFAMGLDPALWLDAPEPLTRPTPPAEPEHHAFVKEPYNPLVTLQPRNYSVQLTPGNFGQAAIVSVSGNDIAGHHGVALSLRAEAEKPELQGDLSYVYGRLPADLTAHLFRSITPRGGYSLGKNYHPLWVQEAVGAETGINYALQAPFDGQSLSLRYSATRVGGEFPLPKAGYDPYETPTFPRRGFIASTQLGWSYSNAEGFLWGVGAEKGFSVSASLQISDPALASDFSGYAASLNFVRYFAMPWARHHALALHGGAWDPLESTCRHASLSIL